jgi:hypothetical protein
MRKLQICRPFKTVNQKGIQVKSIPNVPTVELETSCPDSRKRFSDMFMRSIGVVYASTIGSGGPLGNNQ